MKSITRLVTAVAVMFAVATLCPAQDVKPIDLGKGSAFYGKKIEIKDFVYDSSGAEVAKDDSPGPKCSVKVTPAVDGQYKFVITNGGGANMVTFKVKVAK